MKSDFATVTFSHERKALLAVPDSWTIGCVLHGKQSTSTTSKAPGRYRVIFGVSIKKAIKLIDPFKTRYV